MKNGYKSILYMGMVLVVLVSYFYSKKPLIEPESEIKTQKRPVTTSAPTTEVPETVLSDIRSMLEKQEYNISRDEKTRLMQSPNRRHNLRAYYEPGLLTVQARVDTTGHRFKLVLVNEGIFVDGKPLHAPQFNARTDHHENRVEIRHSAFTEEFINDEDGIRQNFIIHEAPANTRQLQVRMATKGLKVRQGEDNELRFYTECDDGSPQIELSYSDLKCWDANQKPLAATLTLRTTMSKSQ